MCHYVCTTRRLYQYISMYRKSYYWPLDWLFHELRIFPTHARQQSPQYGRHHLSYARTIICLVPSELTWNRSVRACGLYHDRPPKETDAVRCHTFRSSIIPYPSIPPIVSCCRVERVVEGNRTQNSRQI